MATDDATIGDFVEAIEAESDEIFGSSENIERLAVDFAHEIAAQACAEERQRLLRKLADGG